MDLGPLPRRCGGFSMADVLLSLTLIALGLLGLSQGVLAAVRSTTANREMVVAVDAAQARLEQLRGENLSQVLALYNNDPLDDPPGGAPGGWFVVDGRTSSQAMRTASWARSCSPPSAALSGKTPSTPLCGCPGT